MSRKSTAQQYKGLDAHLHVTVSHVQKARLSSVAKRRGVPLSVVIRGLIDEMEVSK